MIVIGIRVAAEISIAAERRFVLPVSRALVAESSSSRRAGSIFSASRVRLVAVRGVPAVAGTIIGGQPGGLVSSAGQFVPRTCAAGDATSECAISAAAG